VLLNRSSFFWLSVGFCALFLWFTNDVFVVICPLLIHFFAHIEDRSGLFWGWFYEKETVKGWDIPTLSLPSSLLFPLLVI
jgi:hypothetical protein